MSLSSISSALPVSALRPQTGVEDLSGLGESLPLTSTSKTGAAQGSDSFGNILGRMVQDVNAKQNAATAAVSDLQSGQNTSIHQAMIAMEEANVSFQLMVEVRNKLLDSYQEIMRMQV